MSDYQLDRKWSDRFVPHIKKIVAEFLFAECDEEDRIRNSDLIVLRLKSVRIACRVRRYKYLAKYGSQFTIRSERTSGTETELSKLLQGWGDYFFYGFSDLEETGFARWFFADLEVFRRWYARPNATIVTQKPNADNRTFFSVFNLSNMPTDFIVGDFGFD